MKILSKLKKTLSLTRFELILWLVSIIVLVVSSSLGGGNNTFNLVTSLVGVTALIYMAKGEPLGQILTIIFSIVYAIASYAFHYYGEMITYLAMTLPSAIFATIVWFKNPHEEGSSQVRIASLTKGKMTFIGIVSPLVMFIFYFILRALDTPNLIISTISILTSVVASLLTFFRSRYYALGYALNDIVLIILWTLATLKDITYLPLVICFIIFFINDLYALYNWKRLEQKQAQVLSVKEQTVDYGTRRI